MAVKRDRKGCGLSQEDAQVLSKSHQEQINDENKQWDWLNQAHME